MAITQLGNAPDGHQLTSKVRELVGAVNSGSGGVGGGGKIVRLMRDSEGAPITFDQLLVYEGEDEANDSAPEYGIYFSDSVLQPGDLVEDLILTFSETATDLFPCVSLGNYGFMLSADGVQLVLITQGIEEEIGMTYYIGTLRFPSQARRDEYLGIFAAMHVNLAYASYTRMTT